MPSNKESALSLPKKAFLSIFLFALVMLAGRVIYAGFNGFAACFAEGEGETEAASAAADPRKALVGSVAERGTMDVLRNSDGDIALRLYRSAETRDAVVAFYSELTGDRDITEIILKHADQNNISPSLAFALSWEESRFKPTAVNRNAASVDRGLFQLNSKAFPDLSEEEMFNPDVNAKNGLSHLRYCIDQSGNEVAALAMYNAGTTAVRNGRTPKRTLDYVSRILSYRENVDIGLIQFVVQGIL